MAYEPDTLDFLGIISQKNWSLFMKYHNMISLFSVWIICWIELQLPKNGVELLDVMVFIHGGGFMFGEGYIQFPDYIMNDNDIVYVSINYRVGILGE